MYAFAAYERHTGSRHPLDKPSNSSSTSRLKRASSGIVVLDNAVPDFWFGDITMGTPSQSFRGKASSVGFVFIVLISSLDDK